MNNGCDMCENGWIYTEDENGYLYARKCKCLLQKEAYEMIKHSGISQEFRSRSFENYDSNNNPQLIDAKNTAKDYAESITLENIKEAPSIMFCGQVGSGKTHLGIACSIVLIEKGIQVIYMDYRKEITSLKSVVMDHDMFAPKIDEYKNAEVLFIDDFLKGKTTESDINYIFDIINFRYFNRKPIIISTEKSLQELENFDEAVCSRIVEMCKEHIVLLSGARLNYRLYGKENSV